MTEIAFIGFGELGSSLAEGLAGPEEHRLRAHVRSWPHVSDICRRRLQTSATVPCAALADAVAGADVVLAAVPATVAVEVARTAAPHLTRGAVYADLATASPADKLAAAQAVGEAGAAYADAAVLGTVAVDRFRVPILASGPGADRLRILLEPHGFRVTAIDAPVGHAALVKLLRSAYLKGRDALIVQTLLAARRHGLQEIVTDTLERPGDMLPFEQIAARVLCSVAVHAERRSHELREVGEVLREVDVDPALARAASEVLAGIAALDLGDVLDDGRPTDPDVVLAVIDERARAASRRREAPAPVDPGPSRLGR